MNTKLIGTIILNTTVPVYDLQTGSRRFTTSSPVFANRGNTPDPDNNSNQGSDNSWTDSSDEASETDQERYARDPNEVARDTVTQFMISRVAIAKQEEVRDKITEVKDQYEAQMQPETRRAISQAEQTCDAREETVMNTMSSVRRPYQIAQARITEYHSIAQAISEDTNLPAEVAEEANKIHEETNTLAEHWARYQRYDLSINDYFASTHGSLIDDYADVSQEFGDWTGGDD